MKINMKKVAAGAAAAVGGTVFGVLAGAVIGGVASAILCKGADALDRAAKQRADADHGADA